MMLHQLLHRIRRSGCKSAAFAILSSFVAMLLTKRTAHLLVFCAASVAALLVFAGQATASAKHRPVTETVEVKFKEETSVRLRGGRLTTQSPTELAALNGVLREFPGLQFERLFTRPEADLDREEEALERRSGRRLADLNLYYRIDTDGKEQAQQLIQALNKLDLVETAYSSPPPSPSPATPSFVSMQGYGSAAPTGIDVGAAAAYAGAKGDRVKVVDVEYSWNLDHEDLSRARGTFIASSPNPYDYWGNRDHGTAVLGELIGSDNGIGVTGLVPNASVAVVNQYDRDRGSVLANAIDVARANMSPGDVLLIEAQEFGWNCADKKCYVPVEWIPAVFDAIVRATAAGIIVIEPAGNGGQNLDDPFYASRFGPGRPDSGAIIVGAGGSPACSAYPQPARSRLEFSTYGSRVDVQGWGECVATTGYGDLFGSGFPNFLYTQTFSGTSSASPIVAAAAASLSSAVETTRGIRLTSTQARSILLRTGTPQDFTSAGALGGKVGPLPNLKAALADQLGPPATDTTKPVVTVPSQAVSLGWSLGTTAVPTTISWTGSDTGGSGLSHYILWQSTDDLAYQEVSRGLTTSVARTLEPGHRYTFVVDAVDGAGNQTRVYGPTFTVDAHQETSTAIAYASSWSRNLWSPAYGGYQQTSATPGASAQLTFTGRSVAWITPKASNRGRAHLYLDGVFVGTFDQFAASTTAKTVLYSRSFTTAGTHTLKVVAEGTVGRPSIDVDAFIVLR